jgi:hypothetical protein
VFIASEREVLVNMEPQALVYALRPCTGDDLDNARGETQTYTGQGIIEFMDFHLNA